MSDAYKPPGAPVGDPAAPPLKLGRRPWPISVASLLTLLAAGARFERRDS